MNCYRCATPIPDSSRFCFACGADVSGDTGQGTHSVRRDPELEAKLAEELQGDFVIEKLLGRGGMAVVFLARDLQLDRKSWVAVPDFGIAKAIGLQSLRGSDSMIGTPYYISPEQCSGGKTVTGASDQYSLGVMAYQMLSGRLPFTGVGAVDIIKQHCF